MIFVGDIFYLQHYLSGHVSRFVYTVSWSAHVALFVSGVQWNKLVCVSTIPLSAPQIYVSSSWLCSPLSVQ